MAFDQPLEADSVDDLGLIGSLIRAPVVGIMWLLGGEHAKEDGEEANKEQGHERIEHELSAESSGDQGGDRKEENDGIGGHADRSDGCNDPGNTAIVSDLPDASSPATPVSIKRVDEAEVKGINKENEEPSSLRNWPSVDFSLSSQDNPSNRKNKDQCLDDTKSSTARPCSVGQSSSRIKKSSGVDCPATQIIDDLVTAMESSHITNDASNSPGPASAVLSQSEMTSSSTDSLVASYSASTFSTQHHTHQTLSTQSSVNNSVRHSSSASTNLRGSKKMSWSDECGNRSLVEYFDDSSAPSMSKHWSSMRRNSWRASRHSFDGGESSSRTTRRSEVRVIKSALKRSGSYSPPLPSLYASNTRRTAFSSSTDSSCASSSSLPEMKSFRSLSVIGSSPDSSRSNSLGLISKESMHSHDTNDSMAAVTDPKLSSNDVQCIPSTLQVGCGRASGGLIIPRGGPGDTRYYFPTGGPNDPRYQVILGTAMPGAHGQETKATIEQGGKDETKDDSGDQEDEAPERIVGPPNPATNFTGGRSSPGHHHHFLPRHHTNGYISPQYGFYVNITPPTPELYAARKTLKSGDKPPRSAAHEQSYQQFQYQSKYQAPSPIPEGRPGELQGIPQRFIGGSSVPRPSSNRTSPDEQNPMSAARKNSMKPTFTKNKKGMGMLLAENPHHGVWPTVPFG